MQLRGLIYSGMQIIIQCSINHLTVERKWIVYFLKRIEDGLVWFMVFNKISVISWLSVLLVEETGVPVENHQPVASH